MGKGIDMKSLLKEVQRTQAQIEAQRSKLDELLVEKSSGGGGVTVRVNGKLRLTDVHINEDVFRNGDVELLKDMILTATNAALDEAESQAGSEMNKVTGGMLSQLKLG